MKQSDIVFTSWGMVVNVSFTKTIKYKERILEVPICTIPGSVFCAVIFLRNHFKNLSSDGSSPLFLKRVNGVQVPIKYREMLSFLKVMSAKIGKDPTTVGLHSLRHSGSFFMHQLGVPLEDIKCVGDWRSMAELMYLISPLDRKLKIDQIVAQALQKI